jgi:hypothetical protein
MEIGAGLWLLGALIVGLVASREFGRSAPVWFFLSIFFSPLVGVLLFVMPPRRVPCPFCAEPIKPSAVVCRFCGRSVTPSREHGLFSGTVRVVLLGVILFGIVLALSRCDYQVDWWQKSRQFQVVSKAPSHSFFDDSLLDGC